MKAILALILFLISVATASAQSVSFDRLTPPLPNQTSRKVADLASYATVGIPLALDAYSAWKGDNRKHDLFLMGARLGVVAIAGAIAKGDAHRLRPCAPSCGIDQPNTSFFSLHTAFAFSTLGGPRLRIALPLAAGTGGLRIAAGKHWLTDVLAGAAVGTLAANIR